MMREHRYANKMDTPWTLGIMYLPTKMGFIAREIIHTPTGTAKQRQLNISRDTSAADPLDRCSDSRASRNSGAIDTNWIAETMSKSIITSEKNVEAVGTSDNVK
jgi:hypothetical protein